MSDKTGFEVTIKDLETGETGTRIVQEGDYFLACFGECYLDGMARYEKKGTTVLTIKNHRPVQPAEDGS